MPIYFFCFGFYWKRDARNLEVMKIKGLLEPAHSCYGWDLHWFLGLAEYRYGWIRFMWTFKTFGINFLLFLGSCVIRKLVHSSWWELEKSLCGLEVGWAEVIRQTTPSAGCNISHNADCRSNYLLNIPCPFLDIFCFKQSGRCNWFLSKRPQSFLVEFQVFV